MKFKALIVFPFFLTNFWERKNRNSYFKETKLESILIAAEKLAAEEVAVKTEIVNKQQQQISK
jgi:LPS sulfotransferase NodH